MLDEIERLGLRQHAYKVGAYLRERVRQLQHTDAGKILGQVRGAGLFIGTSVAVQQWCTRLSWYGAVWCGVPNVIIVLPSS